MYRVTSSLMLLSQLLYTAMAFEVHSGRFSTCAFNNNKITCWGRNEYGQLGLGHTTDVTEPLDTAIDLGDDFLPSTVSCGAYHCCSVSEVGSLKCWGRNNHGQLGYGDTNDRGDNANEMGNNLELVNLGTDFVVDHLAAQLSGMCAMSTTSEIKCWGWNGQGENGYGDTNKRGDESGEMGDDLPSVDLGDFDAIKLIEGGGSHMCALSSAKEVKCWGWNALNRGQLGQGDTENRGDEPGDMGDNLSPIDLGNTFVISEIKCGGYHTCALSTDGDFKCWGIGTYGQLGYGDQQCRGDGSSEMGDYLPFVDLGTGFVVEDFALRLYSTCVISTAAEIKCFGYNSYGQLGNGDTRHRGDSVNEMGNELPIVDVGSGFTSAGIRLADQSKGRHFCVYEESSENLLKCWGFNAYGQLGYGDTENRGDESGEMGDYLPFVDLGTWAIVTTAPVTAAPTQPTAAPTEPTAAPTQPTAAPTEPTAAPTEPTASPTAAPTQSPTEACSDSQKQTVNWYNLFHGGSDQGSELLNGYSVTWDAQSFSLAFSATLQYVGLSADGDSDDALNLGTTYWVDLQSFDQTADSINNAGSCGNRRNTDYDALDFADWWQYTVDPADLVSATTAQRTAYPASDWSLTSSDCTTIKYERTLDLTALAECADASGQALVDKLESADKITFAGSFFVEVVSPYTMASSDYYRVYPLVQHEFTVELGRTLNTLASTGVKLIVSSVMSFNHDDADDYVMRVLMQSADYLSLDAPNVLSTPDGVTVSAIEEETSGCIDSSFLCLQVFKLTIPSDIDCSSASGATSIDLGGTFQMAFTPQCLQNDAACTTFIGTLPESGQVAIDVDWDFVDETCGVDLFAATFESALTFYKDAGFTTAVSDGDAFGIGDVIYGEIVVAVPADNALFDLLDVSIDKVYVCTSSNAEDLESTLNVADGTGGCLATDSVDADGPYLVIGTGADTQYEGTTLGAAGNNDARFSFVAFNTPRETISVHVQLLLTLQTATGTRRRRLLEEVITANQIRHSLQSATVAQPEEEGFGVEVVGMAQSEEGFGIEVVMGTAIGSAAIVGMAVFVVMVLMKRSKKRESGKGTDSGVGPAVHVPDLSPSNMVPPTTGAVTIVFEDEAAEEH